MSSQTDKAYHILKARIVNLELPPGSVIKENELMQELELGRTPIREALQRLARDDLVVILPRRGMYVAEVGVTDLKHIFEARIPLEIWCARLAAGRVNDTHLMQLEKAIALAEENESADYLSRMMESDRQVHSIISEATGNKFLIDGVRWLYDLAARIWRLAGDPTSGSDFIQQQHRELLEALRARDADRAEEVMRQHVHEFWDYVRTQV